MARGFSSFEGGGSVSAPFIDARDFDAAAVALFEMADWIEDTDTPLQQAKQIAIQDMADRFDNQVDPLGRPWEKLDRAYAKEKQLAVGFVDPILTRSTDLREAAIDQTAWFIEGDSIMFSTADLPDYWKFHQQEGGRLPKTKSFTTTRMKVGRFKGQVVKNPNDPSGLFPRKETVEYEEHGMPQRAFIGLSVEAQAEIEFMVDQWLNAGFTKALGTFEAAGGGKTSLSEGLTDDGIIRKIVKGAGGKPQWHIGGKWGPMV